MGWDVALTKGRVVPFRSGFRVYLPRVGYVRTFRGLPIKSRDVAEQVLAHFHARLAHDPIDVVAEEFKPPRRADHTVDRWAQRFLADFKRRTERGDRSTNSLAEYERWASDHWRPLADRTVMELEAFHVLELERALEDRDLHPNTVTKCLGGFHRLLTFAREHLPKRFGFVVPDFPRRSKRLHTPRIVALEVQDQILAAIPEDRRGIFLALRLGIRPSEGRAFNVTDYDLRAGVLDVRWAMQGQTHNARRSGTKEATRRLVEADPELRTWIERHVPRRHRLEDRPLFEHPAAAKRKGSTTRWTMSSLEYQWRKASSSIGVGWVRLYEGTKHASASAAVRSGASLYEVQRALGHKDSRSTELYAQLQPVTPAALFRGRRSDTKAR